MLRTGTTGCLGQVGILCFSLTQWRICCHVGIYDKIEVWSRRIMRHRAERVRFIFVGKYHMVTSNGCGCAARTRLGVAEGEAGSAASNVNRLFRRNRETIDPSRRGAEPRQDETNIATAAVQHNQPRIPTNSIRTRAERLHCFHFGPKCTGCKFILNVFRRGGASMRRRFCLIFWLEDFEGIFAGLLG